MLRRSRLMAAGRLQDIEAEIAMLRQAFPDLPVKPAIRVHTCRRRDRVVPLRSGTAGEQLH